MKAKNQDCGICGKAKPGYVMQNKLVCMRCDELLFDLEIELDVEPAPAKELPSATQKQVTINISKK